jgi:hypothetical protein
MGATPQPLESLRILVSCVRHDNFSRAAEELGITPAATTGKVSLVNAMSDKSSKKTTLIGRRIHTAVLL